MIINWWLAHDSNIHAMYVVIIVTVLMVLVPQPVDGGMNGQVVQQWVMNLIGSEHEIAGDEMKV